MSGSVRPVRFSSVLVPAQCDRSQTRCKRMANVVLYGVETSPPVRACLLTLTALDIPFGFEVVDVFPSENLPAEFLKHNPQQTVPVLRDNGFWIWDSHAINAYLVDKYANNDSLYPKDLAKRAVVNQRLFFEASVLFMSLRNIFVAIFKKGITIVTRDTTQNILEGYGFVENFLAGNAYVAGDTLTIADFATVSTLTSLNGIVPIEPKKYPNISAWLKRMSDLPYYEKANGKGVHMMLDVLLPKFTQIII